MQSVKPVVALVGIGLGVGLFALTRKAKAAKPADSSAALPSDASNVPTPPAPEPSPPSGPPLLSSDTSTAQEGDPLAWDRGEHPLAERDSREHASASTAQEGGPLAWDRSEHPLAERDSRDLSVEPAIVIDIQATESNIKDYSPAELAAMKQRAAATPLDRGVVRPAAPAAAKPAAPKPAAPKPAAPAAAKPAPKPAAPKPAAPAAAKPAAPKPAAPAAAKPAPKRTPAQAASALYAHADSLLKAGRGAELGVKGKPSAVVLAAQRDMGGIVADGMYGPGTRDRGKQLIGKTFPIRK